MRTVDSHQESQSINFHLTRDKVDHDQTDGWASNLVLVTTGQNKANQDIDRTLQPVKFKAI